MEKTIETKFFEAFEFGGLVHWCIDFVKQKYDLGFKGYKNDKPRVLSERDKQFYFDELPKIINARFDEFDRSVIETLHSPLIDEIEQNLQGCQNAVERDIYIFSLITPFEELSGIIRPIAEIDRLKKRISDIGKEIEYWNKLNQDEQLKNMSGVAAGTPREQLEACREEIDRLCWQVERKEEVSKKFVELICGRVLEKGTVEYCLFVMSDTMRTYSDRLFAMLIQHGIDLRTYQKKAGIYLKQYFAIPDIDFYVGSMELAQYYLDNLPTATINDEQPTISQDEQPQINSDLQKVLETAIEKGFVSKDNGKYKWEGTGRELACFAEIAHERNLTKYKWKDIEELFGKKNLAQSNYQATNYTGPASNQMEIEKLFE